MHGRRPVGRPRLGWETLARVGISESKLLKWPEPDARGNAIEEEEEEK
jgi:hypothetical protein